MKMLPEEKELLEQTIALEEENNKMLRSLYRSMKIGRWVKIVYFLLIIGSAAGAYYFIQPYIDQLLGIYGGASSGLDSMNSLLDSLK